MFKCRDQMKGIIYKMAARWSSVEKEKDDGAIKLFGLHCTGK